MERACGAGLVGLLLLLASCATSPPMGELQRVQDEQFEIQNPAPVGASATGIGCGATEQEALERARRTAQFNLRGVTGGVDYRVEFGQPRQIPDEGRVCREVTALAVPRR